MVKYKYYGIGVLTVVQWQGSGLVGHNRILLPLFNCFVFQRVRFGPQRSSQRIADANFSGQMPFLSPNQHSNSVKSLINWGVCWLSAIYSLNARQYGIH